MILVTLIKLHKSNRCQYVTCIKLSILAMQFLLVIMNKSSFDVKKNEHN